jgi:hypothetical protein
VGAKFFSLAFEGGRAAPYHITEKRGRYFGSLWLGLQSLKWLLTTWGVLRQTEDLKGFFRFQRTNYSTLELSCLHNKNGRFVEISEYHGGAQRGRIRVPEGFRGTGWDLFIKELDSFFLGKAAPAKKDVGKPRNGSANLNLELRDTRDFNQSVGSSNPVNSAGMTSILPRVKMVPNAPRPTRHFNFNWEPFPSTLRIIVNMGEKRKAQPLGLKHRAIGLAQPLIRASSQAQVEEIRSAEMNPIPGLSNILPEPSKVLPLSADFADPKEAGPSKVLPEPLLLSMDSDDPEDAGPSQVLPEPAPPSVASDDSEDDSEMGSSDCDDQVEERASSIDDLETAIVCVASSPCSSVWVDLAMVVSDQQIESGVEMKSVSVFENGETSQASLASLGGKLRMLHCRVLWFRKRNRLVAPRCGVSRW